MPEQQVDRHFLWCLPSPCVLSKASNMRLQNFLLETNADRQRTVYLLLSEVVMSQWFRHSVIVSYNLLVSDRCCFLDCFSDSSFSQKKKKKTGSYLIFETPVGLICWPWLKKTKSQEKIQEIFFICFLAKRWEDWYHSSICVLNIKLEPLAAAISVA